MSSIYEQIHEFLGEQNKPVGVAAFLDDARFQQCSRAELNGLLLGLCREGQVRRCIRQGKMLFTLQPQKDEVTNPCSAFIANMQSGLNGFLFGMRDGGTEEEQASGLAGLGRALNQYTFNNAVGDEAEKYGSLPELTFEQGRRFENDQYSIAIPDGFHISENEEDRDFIMWLPSSTEPDEWQEGRMILYAGALTELSAEVMEQVCLPESLAALLEEGMWQSKSQLDMIEDTDLYGISGPVEGVIMAGEVNANIQICFKHGVKQMRAQLGEALPEGQRYAYVKLMRNWIGTIQLKQQWAGISPLDAPECLAKPLSAAFVSEQSELVQKWKEALIALHNLKANSLVAQINYRRTKGDMPKSTTDRMIRDLLEANRERQETLAAQAVRVLKHYSEKAAEDKQLLKLYEALEPVFEQNQWEDGDIVVTSEKIIEYRKEALTPAVEKLRNAPVITPDQLTLTLTTEDCEQIEIGKDAEGADVFLEYEQERDQLLEERSVTFDKLIGVFNRIHSPAEERLRQHIKSANMKCGDGIADALHRLKVRGMLFMRRGGSFDFAARMHDYLEAEIDALQLAVYVETSAGDTWEFRFKAPDYVLKLPIRWTEYAEKEKERRRQEHEQTITRMRESVATLRKHELALQEAIGSAQTEAEQAAAAYEESERTIASRLDQVRSDGRRRIRDCENHRNEAQRRLTTLQQQKADAEAELAKAFVLAVGKKKTLRERIDSLNREIGTTQVKLAEFARLVDQACDDAANALQSVNEEHERLRLRMEETAQRCATLPEELRLARERLAKGKASLQALLAEKNA